jgi:hypothetical protein
MTQCLVLDKTARITVNSAMRFRTRKPLKIKGFELGHRHACDRAGSFIDGKFTGCSHAHPRNKKRY